MATDLRFTGTVDRRFAWLGNDAVGELDLEPALISFINSATTSVAVSSMTFSLDGVGDALAAAANAGRTVRIVGNAGHRFQNGWFRAQRGPVHLVDNNLPALFVRISFQDSGAPAVPGFAVDSGLTFGVRPNGMSYGWDVDVSSAINAHSAPAAFTTPLLGQCYARQNNVAPRTWSISLPPGFYYVVAVTGEANFNSKSFITAQGGQTLFTFKDASGLHYSDHTDCAAGEFKCSIADGGRDEDSNEPQGRRLDCNSGTLSLLVGNAAAPSFTSLDYLEIYRASPTFPDGDPNTDRTFVQERQLHHTKFVLLDAATAARKLWTGSHNLTPVTPIGSRSEDVFTTEDANICAAFLQEFERWWGGAAAIPNPANSFFGRFKTPAIAPSGTMPSILLPSGTFPWRVAFSPSNTPSLDMYQVCADHINAATKDILFLMEQFTDSGDLGPLHSTNFLMNNDLDPQVTSGLRLIGLIGNSDLTDSIYTRYAGDPDVAIAHSTSTHDKIALIDALRDTRQSHAGRMLCGSMNWSQGAFHINDEQTLLLGDPALANKALQRAMSGFVGAGLVPVEPADIIVVIDRSFSMTEVIPSGGTKMDAARTAADTFLDMLTADGTHRVALVRFGASVEPFAPPEALVPFTNARRTTLHGRLMATTATLPIGGSTCYGLPLLEAQNLLTGIGSPHPRRIVVFLTDGEENTPPNADGIYQPLAATGAEIHTTAFGTFDPFNTTGANSILNDMAVFSGGTFAQIDVDPVHLQKRFAEVARDAMGMVTVMDPTFEVSGRKAVRCKVPIDLFEGIVEFCAFWRATQGSIIALVRTPWGDVLTPKQAGVTHQTGSGRDVWRVDIGRVARAAGKVAAGIWVVELRAVDPRAAAIRTDVAVYASRGGGADLRVEIDRDKEGVFILARVLDGQRVAKANVEAVVFPPPTSRKRKPRTIRLKPVESKDPAWEGVLMARWPIEEEGVHALHVVATGKTKKGEFRREAVTRWVQEPTPPRAPGRPAPEPLPKRDPTTGTIPKRKRSG